uniref:Uncharacterized protein n=1 Tax=mine drainage metagenome TaxID=410659 RepID=E6QQC7_9ZZZZ
MKFFIMKDKAVRPQIQVDAFYSSELIAKFQKNSKFVLMRTTFVV